MKLLLKIILFVLALIAVISCVVCVVILSFSEWRMLLTIIGLIASVVTALILFIEIITHVSGTIKTNYWGMDFDEQREDKYDYE
jgi:sensor histidine kinase YesM